MLNILQGVNEPIKSMGTRQGLKTQEDYPTTETWWKRKDTRTTLDLLHDTFYCANYIFNRCRAVFMSIHICCICNQYNKMCRATDAGQSSCLFTIFPQQGSLLVFFIPALFPYFLQVHPHIFPTSKQFLLKLFFIPCITCIDDYGNS